MNATTPDPDNTATTRGEGDTRRRPRRAPEIVVAPSIAVPLDPQRRKRAVAALTALLTQWWDQHGHHLDPADHDGADGSSSDDD
jgi:hypothetical protein